VVVAWFVVGDEGGCCSSLVSTQFQLENCGLFECACLYAHSVKLPFFSHDFWNGVIYLNAHMEKS
jgi:hypothetical protein